MTSAVPLMRRIEINPRVALALKRRAAVVAMETAVITHGLPRAPFHRPPEVVKKVWDESLFANEAMGVALHSQVESVGAVPASIGVHLGSPTIGLDFTQLRQLARDESAMKVSTRDLAIAMFRGVNAGTTVAATAHLCAIAQPNPICVFATGGIGGVHRGWPQRADVSADLAQLANTPVCIVCAGAKSILDGAATLELLDSLRVPVIGFQTSRLPRFICRGDDSLPLPHRVEHAREVAAICRIQWHELHHRSALVVCREVDESDALDAVTFDAALVQAEGEARMLNLAGSSVTPWLLSRISDLTGGDSLRANLSVLSGNALLAADIATAMAEWTESSLQV